MDAVQRISAVMSLKDIHCSGMSFRITSRAGEGWRSGFYVGYCTRLQHNREAHKYKATSYARRKGVNLQSAVRGHGSAIRVFCQQYPNPGRINSSAACPLYRCSFSIQLLFGPLHP